MDQPLGFRYTLHTSFHVIKSETQHRTLYTRGLQSPQVSNYIFKSLSKYENTRTPGEFYAYPHNPRSSRSTVKLNNLHDLYWMATFTRISGSGAAAGCCAFSRPRGASHQWCGGICGPCQARGSCARLTSARASLCACGRAW